MAWYPILAVGTLVCLVLCYMMFIIVYFDNSEHSLDEVIMQKIKLLTKREKLNEEMVRKTAKKYQTEIVNNKQDLFEKTKNLKVIFLKPIELKNSIDW
ncbi:MAG: hypothetical protein LBU14_06395 [Candidatus Peribacteria bacterium]|nr:hypothetical protein [Candidatus Peribacteria bacterium]